MNKPKNILFITPGFPTDETDTRCIPPLQSLALGLHKRDYTVRVIALHYPYRRRRYEWHGIDVNVVGIANHPTFRPVGWMRARRYMKNLVEKNKVDLIHSFWLSEAALLGQQFSKKYNIPHVCTLMGQDAAKSDGFQKRLNPTEVKKIGLSTFQAKAYTERTGLELEKIIPWGLDNALFKSINQSAEKQVSMADKKGQSNEKQIDLIGVGNLIILKNYDLFLNVLKRLKVDFPKIKAALIGGGSQKQHLETLSEQLGVHEQIEWLGILDRESVLQKMKSSRVLLHTSNYESYGMVIPEALALGCQVVSRPVGIAPQLSEHIKIADDEEGLYQACLTALSAKAKAPIIPFSLSDTLDQYESIYAE